MKRVIGITGGIASGKSNVCNIIKELGYSVIDSDQIYRELTEVGKPCYNAILKAFGEEYFHSNKKLNRKKLGKLIFNNSAAKTLLNNITHPLIVEEIKTRIHQEKDGLVFVDIPLLYETKMQYLCDRIICVFLNKKQQIERLMARDGINEDYALAKIHSQMDLYEKQHLANYVVDSSGTFEQTKEKVLKILELIKGEEYGSNS